MPQSSQFVATPSHECLKSLLKVMRLLLQELFVDGQRHPRYIQMAFGPFEFSDGLL